MKYLSTRLSLFICIVFFSLPSEAQRQIDLAEALTYALENHSSIKSAKLEIDKGEELVRESLSVGLPQINASATMVNNPAIRTSLVPAEFFGGSPGEFAQVQFGTKWYGSAGVQLNQIVFNKEWLLGLEATRELQDFYQYNVERSEEEVVYEVAKLYYQIQLTQTQSNLLKANLDQIDGLLKAVSLQYENGFAKKIDVDRLSVQKSNLEIEMDNLELQVEQMEQALKYSMQMPLEEEIILTDSITESTISAIDFISFTPSFSERPVLKILDKEIQLYDLDERRYKSGYFPNLNFFANYNYEWQANGFNQFGNGNFWTDFSQVGLALNIPIFDGFFKSAKRETAILNGIQKSEQKSMVLLGYELQHQTAVTTMRVNQNKLRTVQNTLATAQEVYRITQKRYAEGVAPITELLNSETALRESQSNYISTLAQIKLAEIDLLHANGKLVDLANR